MAVGTVSLAVAIMLGAVALVEVVTANPSNSEGWGGAVFYIIFGTIPLLLLGLALFIAGPHRIRRLQISALLMILWFGIMLAGDWKGSSVLHLTAIGLGAAVGMAAFATTGRLGRRAPRSRV